MSQPIQLLCASLFVAFALFAPSTAEAQQPGIFLTCTAITTPSCGANTYLRQLNGRTYRIHGNPAWAPEHTQHAVVLNFHQLGGSAQGQEIASQMNATADTYGFYVVYPEARWQPLAEQRGWRAGPNCCPYPADTGDLDIDVNFALSIIDDLIQFNSPSTVNAKKIYATGFSNGAFMAYHLACQRPDRIAAIAPVGGSLDVGHAPCAAGRAVPLAHFHGTADDRVPINGGPNGPPNLATPWGPPQYRRVPYNGVDTTPATAVWAVRNGCSDPPAAAQPLVISPAMTCYYAAGCDYTSPQKQVALCVTSSGPGMNHSWPPAANALMWLYVFDKVMLP